MTGATLTIQGRLTADPELRFTQAGVPVANFTVAHTHRKLDRSTNEWVDDGDTLFMRTTVWREHGENLAASLHKGDAVIVIGRLVSRSYETKEGEKRTVVELDAEVCAVDLRRARADVTRTTSTAAESFPAPKAVAA